MKRSNQMAFESNEAYQVKRTRIAEPQHTESANFVQSVNARRREDKRAAKFQKWYLQRQAQIAQIVLVLYNGDWDAYRAEAGEIEKQPPQVQYAPKYLNLPLESFVQKQINMPYLTRVRSNLMDDDYRESPLSLDHLEQWSEAQAKEFCKKFRPRDLLQDILNGREGLNPGPKYKIVFRDGRNEESPLDRLEKDLACVVGMVHGNIYAAHYAEWKTKVPAWLWDPEAKARRALEQQALAEAPDTKAALPQPPSSSSSGLDADGDTMMFDSSSDHEPVSDERMDYVPPSPVSDIGSTEVEEAPEGVPPSSNASKKTTSRAPRKAPLTPPDTPPRMTRSRVGKTGVVHQRLVYGGRTVTAEELSRSMPRLTKQMSKTSIS